ncbi:hypothetical protein MKW35_17345, partial [Aestuariibaculum sp. L182]|nr:hypothetical protein [Aestuariibaculum lutulentum]
KTFKSAQSARRINRHGWYVAMNGRFGRYRRRWQRPAAAPRSLARKLADYLLMLVFFALVALLAARLSVPREVREITGKAYVID